MAKRPKYPYMKCYFSEHRMDPAPSLRFASMKASQWCHVSPTHHHLVLRPKPINPSTPGFEAQSGKPATPHVNVSGLHQSLTPSSISRSHHAGSILKLDITFLLDLTDLVDHHSHVLLVWLCTFWIAHDSAWTSQVPRRQDSTYPSPPHMIHPLACTSSPRGPSHPSWSSPFTTCRWPSVESYTCTS